MTNKKIEIIKSEIIEHFAKLPEMFGMNRAIGVIWGTLVLEPHGLTMAELSKKTGYSLSTLSPYLKTLELVNKIRIKKEKGITRYYARIETERMVEQYMKKIMSQVLEPSIKTLENAEKELKEIKRDKEAIEMLGLVRELKRHQLKVENHIKQALEGNKQK